MQSLPVEIKAAIAEEVRTGKNGTTHLAALRLASRDLAHTTAPTLLRALALSQVKGTSAGIIQFLKKLSGRAPFVKKIKFDVGSSVHRGTPVPKADTLNDSVSIFSRLNSFSGLEELRVSFPFDKTVYSVEQSPNKDDGSVDDDPASKQSEAQKLQIKIFMALAGLSSVPTSLHTFEIYGLFTKPNEGLRMQGIKSFLGGIKHLYITTVSNAGMFRDVLSTSKAYKDFWSKDIVALLTAPIDLYSFALGSDFPAGIVGLDCTAWGSIHWPHLRTLLLRGIIFNETYKDSSRTIKNNPLAITGVESFILLHRTSLSWLELHDCFLNISIPEVPKARMWADVFRGFEKSLINLKRFVISPEPLYPYPAGGDNKGEGYVHPRGEFGYDKTFTRRQAPPPNDAYLDDLALEGLKCLAML
ncbi:hypothetical protein BDN70DRAFT_872983 [Pholiota conissans]|uniref:Uncharacterized protein n=1 Tax=Pholiota conissans TaxID=109636 RepID=A0A9P6D5X7_9AGAR|nr:hypothetical protein BDN70DRAFT_872983 [Pholiota conissans]